MTKLEFLTECLINAETLDVAFSLPMLKVLCIIGSGGTTGHPSKLLANRIGYEEVTRKYYLELLKKKKLSIKNPTNGRYVITLKGKTVLAKVLDKGLQIL